MTAYQNRYVAFIDILGFKDLIDRSENDSEALSRLANILAVTGEISRVQKSFKEGGLDEHTIRVTAFSDNIVISCAIDPLAFYFLISFVACMCNDLLNEGLMTRGGISKGKLIHTDRAVLGSGLIKAYQLESKTANYPRLLIDDCVRHDLKMTGKEKFASNILRKDFDGLHHLNIFHRSFLQLTAKIPTEAKGRESWGNFLEKGRCEIVRSIREGKTLSVRAKAIWLANYYNSSAVDLELPSIQIPETV